MDDEALLAELGVTADAADITELRHVRSSAEKRAAEEIANREKCEDFDKFKPLFGQVQKELAAGSRETRPFVKDAEIGRAHVWTPVTNAHLVCRHLLAKTKENITNCTN